MITRLSYQRFDIFVNFTLPETQICKELNIIFSMTLSYDLKCMEQETAEGDLPAQVIMIAVSFYCCLIRYSSEANSCQKRFDKVKRIVQTLVVSNESNNAFYHLSQ